jgi:hypothetical protein
MSRVQRNTITFSKNTELMPLRQPLKKKHPHQVDIMGIAVALAFLVSISVSAGGRDNRNVSEDGQSPSVSMPIAPNLTMEESKTLQHADEEADLSDLSGKLSASR